MNKKFFALLLSLMMALTVSCAMAATDVVVDTGLSEFDIHFTYDEDIEVDSRAGDGYCVMTFGDAQTEDPNKMIYIATLTISDDTVFEGKDLKDATDEQISRLFNVLISADSGENPYTYEVKDMDDGVRALVILNEATREEVWVFTVQDGVLVQVLGFYPDSHAVTDEDVQTAVKLMDSFEFVPTENANN